MKRNEQQIRDKERREGGRQAEGAEEASHSILRAHRGIGRTLRAYQRDPLIYVSR